MKELTKEERDIKILAEKEREAKDAAYVKGLGLTLDRDSCEECLKQLAKGDEGRGGYGQRIYCSPGHAYEVGSIKKNRMYSEMREKLFTTIYEIGASNKPSSLSAHPEVEEMINEIEGRWY